MRLRDAGTRKAAETRALEAHSRMQGQTLHKFGLDARSLASPPRSGDDDLVTLSLKGIIPAHPPAHAPETLPSPSLAPLDLGKFSGAVDRLEDALRGARDCAAKVKDSLEMPEKTEEAKFNAGEAETAPDPADPQDKSLATGALLRVDSRVDAAMLAAVDKLATSDFNAGTSKNLIDHKKAKGELLAALDNFASTDFEAGEKEKLDSTISEANSKVDSTVSRRNGGPKG